MGTPINVGIMLSRIRVEEKLLLEELSTRGANITKFDDRELYFDLNRPSVDCDVVLERCINHLRALYTLRDSQRLGHSHRQHLGSREHLRGQAADHVRARSGGCADPAHDLAFTPDSALEAIEELGYPVVMKPAVGSWGRLLREGQRPRCR